MNIQKIVNKMVEEYIECMSDTEIEEIIGEALDYDSIDRELREQLEAHVENCVEEAVTTYLDKRL